METRRDSGIALPRSQRRSPGPDGSVARRSALQAPAPSQRTVPQAANTTIGKASGGSTEPGHSSITSLLYAATTIAVAPRIAPGEVMVIGICFFGGGATNRAAAAPPPPGPPAPAPLGAPRSGRSIRRTRSDCQGETRGRSRSGAGRFPGGPRRRDPHSGPWSHARGPTRITRRGKPAEGETVTVNPRASCGLRLHSVPDAQDSARPPRTTRYTRRFALVPQGSTRMDQPRRPA